MEKRNLLKKALTFALVLIMTLGCASTVMARSFEGDKWDETYIGVQIYAAVYSRKGD